MSTNSFWEFNTPKANVYNLFLGDIILLFSVLLQFVILFMSTFLKSLYTTNLSPAWREISLVKGFKIGFSFIYFPLLVSNLNS